MTIQATSPISVVAALRGDRTIRPLADTSSAAGLRAMLEDGLYEVFATNPPRAPIHIRASSLAPPFVGGDVEHGSIAQVRGVLVHQLLRLASVGATIVDPLEDALSAWRSEVVTNDLLEQVARLNPNERARLRTDVAAHFVTLSSALGDIGAGWLTRTSVRAAQRLSGGNVELRDVVDLMVGTTAACVSSVALLDVTTAPLGEGAERSLRFHALVQTLRTSVVPLRSSVFSSATGALWTRDVDFALLARSVDDVVSAVRDRAVAP